MPEPGRFTLVASKQRIDILEKKLASIFKRDLTRRAAGSQLHPQVVEALLSVLSRTEELAGATL